MSVIAYYNGEIGADSMGVCVHTGLWVPQQKIFGHNDSMWAAFCGKSIEQETAMLSMEMMANIIAYMEHADIERYVVDDESKAGQVLFDGLDTIADFGSFFTTRSGCYYVSEDRRVERIDGNLPVTVGSAGATVTTALLHGLKMEKAIRVALDIGPLARGEPVVRKTRTLCKIRRSKDVILKMAKMRLVQGGRA